MLTTCIGLSVPILWPRHSSQILRVQQPVFYFIRRALKAVTATELVSSGGELVAPLLSTPPMSR